MLKNFLTFFSISIAVFIGYLKTIPEAYYPSKLDAYIEENKKLFSNSNGNLLAIVTGSTSGIGKELASKLVAHNIDVIIASRSLKKCEEVVHELMTQFKDDNKPKGKLIPAKLDVGDLDSVIEFSEWFGKHFTELNFLINNAGISYVSDPTNFESGIKSLLSPQKYDQSFATNYFGHVLLTEKMLPYMKNGRIVSTTSGYHYESYGYPLVKSDRGNNTPYFADGTDRDFKFRTAAYGNTKLAQVLHAKKIQRNLDEKKINTIKTFTFCPGWVTTNILPKGAIGKYIASVAFSAEASLTAPLHALFDKDLEGGSFVANYKLPLTQSKLERIILDLFTKMNMKGLIVNIAALLMTLLQKASFGYNKLLSSPESYNVELADQLYDWSIKELKNTHYL